MNKKLFNHKGAYSATEHSANVKFVDKDFDTNGLYPIPVITSLTNGVLYLKTPINYNEKCDELWNEILKMCGLLGGVKKKLSNDKFVNRAKPEIVQKERDKQKYYEDKITITHQQLGMMEHYKLTSKK